MYNWGTEIILESHRIPWLIWIQLLVLFLLILLLSYFGLFSLDFAGGGASAAVSSSRTKISSAVEEEQEERGNQETQTETQRERVRGGESNTESDGSSGKDLHRLLHPRYYLDLAKKAFLQCLGLGSAPSSSRERANDK